MARSRIREEQVLDIDFLSEEEHSNLTHYFEDLGDTPTAFSGYGEKYLRVNSTASEVEFVDITGSVGVWKKISSNYEAASGENLFIDSTVSGIVITLPSNPSMGDAIAFVDGEGNCGTNNITIARNGKYIMDLAENFIVDVDNAEFNLVYYEPTNGWRLGVAGYGTPPETATSKEITYDAFLVAKNEDAHPITQTRANKMSKRQAEYLWDNFEQEYNKCKVRLLCSNGNKYSNGPFSTKAALYTWINSVIPNAASAVTVDALLQVYDEEANDVPSIQKVYGVNSLFCALAGGQRHKQSKTKTGAEGAAYYLDIFVSLVDHFRDDCSTLSGTVTKAALESDGSSKRCFWMPANKQNLYGLPKSDSYVELGNVVPTDYRKWWDFTISGSVTQSGTHAGKHYFQDYAYVSYDISSYSYEVLGSAAAVLENYFFDVGGLGMITVYLVKNSIDSDQYAFYVKPIGINNIYVGYYDPNIYRLEVLGYNKDRQPIFKKITPLQQDLYGDRSNITKNQWCFGNESLKIKNSGFLLPRKYKFRLRRLSDNRVGKVSSAAICPIMRTTGAYIKWMVC